MADVKVQLKSREDVYAFLDGKPRQWSVVLASRAALRVLPLAFGPPGRRIVEPDAKRTLTVIRAAFIAWTASQSDHYDQSFLRAAEAAFDSAFAYDAVTFAYAACTPFAAEEGAAAAAAAAYTAGAYVFPAGGVHAVDAGWEALSADANWLTSSTNEGAAGLAKQPLWPVEVRDNRRQEASFLRWAHAPLDAFEQSEWAVKGPWGVWINWYSEILPNRDGPPLPRQFSEKVAFEIASQPPAFWEQNAHRVTADVAKIVGHKWQERTADELERQAGDNLPPPEPAPGPGPQYSIRGGRLTEHASPPKAIEIEAQRRIHRRLLIDAAALASSLLQVGNRYPELSNAASEYHQLANVSLEEIDVVAIWTVGGALAAFAQSYREQNIARTLADPLEPHLYALLHSVLLQHGAFILGFEEGQDLVNRADTFALDVDRLRDIESSGAGILSQLTENRDLVDDRTRAIHRPIHDSVTEVGWATSRVGYSAYLIVRNSVRAIIKFCIGDSPNAGNAVGLVVGASVLFGDQNADFIRAAVPILQHYGSQLLVFFNHSPEMRAYVEWALRVLENDAKK